MRERDGRVVDRLELDLPPDSQVSEVLRLLNIPANLEVIVALNDQIAAETEVLRDNDRLAIIPAVAGGTDSIRPWFNVHTAWLGKAQASG